MSCRISAAFSRLIIMVIIIFMSLLQQAAIKRPLFCILKERKARTCMKIVQRANTIETDCNVRDDVVTEMCDEACRKCVGYFGLVLCFPPLCNTSTLSTCSVSNLEIFCGKIQNLRTQYKEVNDWKTGNSKRRTG